MNVGHMGTLTLQEVGRQEGGRGVRAGQMLLQKVSLKLQGKQVSRRREKHRSQAQGPWDTRPRVEEDTQPGRTEQTVPRRPGPTALGIHTAGGTPHPGHQPPGARLSRGQLTNSCSLCHQTQPHAQFCGK